jgi:hypothetical protein
MPATMNTTAASIDNILDSVHPLEFFQTQCFQSWSCFHHQVSMEEMFVLRWTCYRISDHSVQRLRMAFDTWGPTEQKQFPIHSLKQLKVMSFSKIIVYM